MPIIKEDPLHKYPLCFKEVKGEVSEAMRDDWKRDKVDDAKKRAIYDARSYDDFKARVAGCTLKPIHKDEFNSPPKFVYNKQAEKTDTVKRSEEAAAIDAAALAAAKRCSANKPSVPRNSRQFERELRRRTGAVDKVALLELLDGDAYANLFGKELDAEVLRMLLIALEEADLALVRGVTRQFLGLLASRCPSSTSTAASFLDAEDRARVTHLLLREPVEDLSQDVRICASFGVPPPVAAAYQLHDNVEAQIHEDEGGDGDILEMD